MARLCRSWLSHGESDRNFPWEYSHWDNNNNNNKEKKKRKNRGGRGAGGTGGIHFISNPFFFKDVIMHFSCVFLRCYGNKKNIVLFDVEWVFFRIIIELFWEFHASMAGRFCKSPANPSRYLRYYGNNHIWYCGAGLGFFLRIIIENFSEFQAPMAGRSCKSPANVFFPFSPAITQGDIQCRRQAMVILYNQSTQVVI